MSYGKKDEDADQGIVKVDRTSIYQEGRYYTSSQCTPHADLVYSTPLQLVPDITKKMPNTAVRIPPVSSPSKFLAI